MTHKKKKPTEAPALPPLSIVPCARCGVSCMVRAPDAAEENHPFESVRAARTARGLCAPCIAHWWLFTVDGVRWTLRDSGPAILKTPAIQHALTRLLAMMHPELATLDWSILLAQWDLPWPDDWTLPVDKNLWDAPTDAPKPDKPDPVRAKAARDNRDPLKRTLTSLYNENPPWLVEAHRRLDAAVFDAYDWPHDLSDDEILARLLALNLARAANQP